MGRLLLALLVVGAILYGLVALTTHIQRTVALAPGVSSAAVILATTANSSNELTDFNESGTLVFYPNNVGPVPYLYYQDTGGKTVARALAFADSPPNNFSSWAGARVSVVGRVEAEHVIVESITYLSGP